MSMTHPRLAAALIAATIGALPIFAFAQAAPPAAVRPANGGIVVHEAWARASAGPATTAAAYVTLMGGTRPDQLTGASTPVAAKAAVHETIHDHGVMKMRPVAMVPVPPGKMVTFAPGGLHIMLTGLKQKLVAGQGFPLTLTFAHAAPVTVEVRVRALGANEPMHMHM